MNRFLTILFVTALGAVFAPAASACAACFGKSDSRLADGMNAGIFALLLVVVLVLGGIAAFFIHLARRANQPLTADGSQTTSETLQSN
ncbi:MAG: hypothetical protein EXS29_05430 [Pedosphaera sp.]|nr:hypothetical protein [Pedosphaera sp.]MST00734.1 hypothetical protein [Pedosphaera sp.]